MILARDEILKAVEKRTIGIRPFTKANVGPASIDLTLGPELRVFKQGLSPVTLTEFVDYKKSTKLTKSDGYTIQPGEMVLGITIEEITLPGNICGWLQGRSRFARLGLQVHMTASFVQPGVKNRTVLEIKNDAPMPVKLKEGLRICQIIFERLEGKARYRGKFQSQRL
jgi:dCTP deaminase